MRIGAEVVVRAVVIVSIAGGVPTARAGERGRAAVAADHALASGCGAEILGRGGNAVDAAVAAALCSGVVQPSGSGLGGGGFAVVVGADGATRAALDFREVAPAAAHRDLFLRPDGTVDTHASQTGGLAVAVPGESRGLAELLQRFGSLPPAAVARPAIRLAARGFPVGAKLADALAAGTGPEVLRELDAEAAPHPPGAVIRRPELAATLRAWARTAGEDLHTGRGAAALAAHVDAAGGALTPEDLATYRPKDRELVALRWGDRTILTMPPPSSGGIALAQVLRALEGVDLVSLGWNSSAYLHRLAEAMKHAYADRAHFLGDPDVVDVPRERLLSEERARTIREDHDPTRTFPAEHYGGLVAPPVDAGTLHLSVVDGAGGAIALTTTINTAFGSELVPPGLGVILNDQMDDFSLAPGVPNAYGLVGSEANAVGPGKRPLSSMTPTVVLGADGRPELVVGASGGSMIISSTLQVLLSVLLFDVPPDEAVVAPRIHHQWTPDVLVVEPSLPADVVDALRAKGHVVRVARAFSSVQAVRVRPDGFVEAGSDPRRSGEPAIVR